MNKYYCLLIFSLLISINTAFAQQNGYVITQRNDTIRCKVWEKTFSGLKYQPDAQSDPKKIKSDDIKEYKLTDDTSKYRAVPLKPGKKPEFLRVIEDGKICLYEQVNMKANGGASTDWYVSKNDSDLVWLKTTAVNLFRANHDDRKKALADMLNDQPKVAAAYNAEDSFSFKNIQRYVHEYNSAVIGK